MGGTHNQERPHSYTLLKPQVGKLWSEFLKQDGSRSESTGQTLEM